MLATTATAAAAADSGICVVSPARALPNGENESKPGSSVDTIGSRARPATKRDGWQRLLDRHGCGGSCFYSDETSMRVNEHERVPVCEVCSVYVENTVSNIISRCYLDYNTAST